MALLVTLCGLLSLAVAAMLAPWRLLRGPALGGWLAALAVVCAMAALPEARIDGVDLRWSGAPLLVLVAGWPMAVLTLALLAVAQALAQEAGLLAAWEVLAWQGLLPAGLALAGGWLVRQHMPRHPFVYLLGRGVGVTAAALFVAGAGRLAANGTDDGMLVAVLLLAFGEAMATGVLVTAMLAARRDWLATYADRLYAPLPPSPLAVKRPEPRTDPGP